MTTPNIRFAQTDLTESMAKSTAVANCTIATDLEDLDAHYDRAIADFDSSGLVPADRFAGDCSTALESEAKTMAGLFDYQMACVQRGIKFLGTGLNGALPAKPETWNMRSLATIGHNLTQVFAGLHFDWDAGAWVHEDDGVFVDADSETGLPLDFNHS